MSSRQCEQCGGAMPGRMHRQTDANGRKVCPSCAANKNADWSAGTVATLEVEASPRHADPAQHPFFQANPIHHDNIVNTYARATDDDKDKGANWYHGAHLVAKAIGQGDAAKGAGLLAIYSPNTAWPTNMFNAATAMERKVGIGGKGSGFFASAQQAAAADKVLSGQHYNDVLKGPKIRDFAHLIENDGDADPNNPHAVIDRHALSVATGRRMSDDDLDAAPLSTDHYYRHVVDAYKKAADVISSQTGRPVSPHQVQATTWLVQQRENAQADAVSAGRLERGRGTAQDNAQKRWDQYADQHYPDLAGPGWHNSRAASAKDKGDIVDRTSIAYAGQLAQEMSRRIVDARESVARVMSGIDKTAHDSGDGQTLFHCPFCGAGALVGSSDGTAECQFCHTRFTVQVQPEFKAMPQTINGQPYNIPGMPGGGPDAGAASQQQGDDIGAAQPGAAPAGAPGNKQAPGDIDKKFTDMLNSAKPAPDSNAPAKKPNPFAASINGKSLTAKANRQRIALLHAEDREAVLARVKEENGLGR